MKYSRHKGHSLLEVLVVVALLSAIAALGVQGFQGMSTRTRGADALAKVVADHFRQTRAKAISDAVPTALVFPSDNGAKPHSQSCFVVSGEDKPKIRRVYDFSGEFSKSCVFVGLTGAAGETLNRPQVGSKLAGFRANNWYPTRDYQFIFLPSGALVCNDLPLVDGKYSVIVAAGLEFIGAAPPGPPADPVAPPPSYFKISEALDPFTITISAETGDVEVRPGVVGATTGRDGWTTPPAAPPPLAPGAASSPTILELEISPEPNPANLPPGLDATIRDGECLSFLVTATDNEGGPLFCEMTVEDSVGNTVEGFATPGAQAMTFDRASQQWTSDSTWGPPPTHPPGTIYTVNCIVTDKEAGAATLDISAAPRVEKRRGGKFLLNGTGGDLAVVNDDGSNFRWLPAWTGTAGARFTSDGKLVAAASGLFSVDGLTYRWIDLGTDATGMACYDVTPDGGSFVHDAVGSIKVYEATTGNLRLLSPPSPAGTSFSGVRCSPDGSHLAYSRQTFPAPPSLVVANWNRTTDVVDNEVVIGNGLGVSYRPDFSPDGELLLWQNTGATSISRADDGVLVTSATLGVTSNLLTSWSPSGDRIAFRRPADPSKIVIVTSTDLSAPVEEVDLSHVLPGGFTINTLDWSK